MIDAVLSVHLTPLTCGVAKFNLQLAKELRVPVTTIGQAARFTHPLISVRFSELDEDSSIVRLRARQYDVFVHDTDGNWRLLLEHAENIYAATPAIAATIRRVRPDVIEAFAPATLHGNPTRGHIDVLVFGMAHRFQAPHFQKLKTLLDSEQPYPYTISLSTGIHEGRSWDDVVSESVSLMTGIFGEQLRYLGFLADDGLARIMTTVNAVALFYDPAARANNTSLWSALKAGKPVITNLDADSPPELQHGVNVFDIQQLTEWPYPDELRIARHGGQAVSDHYGWPRLIDLLTAKVPA